MAHKRNAKYKTGKDEWGTELSLFKFLDDEFHFNIDAACNDENMLCPYGMTDSLKYDWTKQRGIDDKIIDPILFMNPPFSKGKLQLFMAKALEESRKGAIVVCLVPHQSGAKWWHRNVLKSTEIRYIEGRVQYVGYDEKDNPIKNSPMFDSVVVIFDKKEPEAVDDMPCIGRPIIRMRGGTYIRG